MRPTVPVANDHAVLAPWPFVAVTKTRRESAYVVFGQDVRRVRCTGDVLARPAAVTPLIGVAQLRRTEPATGFRSQLLSAPQRAHQTRSRQIPRRDERLPVRFCPDHAEVLDVAAVRVHEPADRVFVHFPRKRCPCIDDPVPVGRPRRGVIAVEPVQSSQLRQVAAIRIDDVDLGAP